MVAEREHAMVVAEVVAHGGSFYAAAIDNSQVFSYYFESHIRAAEEACGCDVYPYAYGTEGSFLIMAAGHHGWWHDPETVTTYESQGTDTDKAIVFGLNADRMALILAAAAADGVTVVRQVRLDTNEVM